MERRRSPAAGSSSYTGGMIATLSSAVRALGRGFDTAYDSRLLYCKNSAGSLLVRPGEDRCHELDLSPGGPVLSDVPEDVCVFRESGRRETAPVCGFHEMAQYFNRKSDLLEKVPLGGFNSMFNFTGSWRIDAASTKFLAMDGYFFPIFKVQLTIDDLILREGVKREVPRSWDPSKLARFIETFGTHVITSITIGGRDEVYLKLHHSSPLLLSDIENYVKDIGDQRFFSFENHFADSSLDHQDKISDAALHHIHDKSPQQFSLPYLSGKEDVTVIFRRRGGDDLVQHHVEWRSTVQSSPDVINMTFVPIVALLDGPGIQHLTRAVDLYLDYKPPIEELQYFLEFQIQTQWAPVHENIPGLGRKEPVCPFLQFSLMGPKLYISSEQVSVGRKPVTGLRLSLEGSKDNRLAIHLQHLASHPKILRPHWDPHVAIGPPKWRGPEEQDSRWFEPIKWKNFAHVSTAPIESMEAGGIGDLSGVYVVTGAQLGVWDFGAKSVLHLKLLFSKVPGCTARRSVWDHSPATSTQASEDSSSSSSAATNNDPAHARKLAKIVDLTNVSRGPQVAPGHWLVTGAKLGVEKGKIVVRVKYSLLNY